MANGQRFLLAAAPAFLIVIFGAGLRLLPSPNDGGASVTEREKPIVRTGKPPGLKPQRADKATQQALEKVVSGQITALSQNDPAAALRYSASFFRDSWTPGRFAAMVQKGYPHLSASRSITYRPAQRAGETAIIRITVESRDGSQGDYVFMLRREKGAWRVESVFAESPPPPGAVMDARAA